jgi:iron complex outermembrane receptor protein
MVVRTCNYNVALIFLLCFIIGVAEAQEKTVQGKVSTELEGPLAGVRILIRGSKTATVTDHDGNYSIVVPGQDAILVFSCSGFRTKSETIGNRRVIDMVMMPESNLNDESVDIGYCLQKKNEITGSIAIVRTDDFSQGFINSPEQLIQGRVAGLSIIKSGGNPNDRYYLRLRGLCTLNANTQPLVIVDDVIGGSLENVDPSDIESMTVLKDASAASIYGIRGSNGVILVHTKKGKPGTSMIEYEGYISSEMVAKNTSMLNAREWRALSAIMGLGTDFGKNTDWFKEIEHTAISQAHHISVSGGADNTTYRVSFNYRDVQGIQINTGFTRLSGKFDITQKALHDRLTLDLSLSATKKDEQLGFSDAFHYAAIYNPTAPVKSNDPAFARYDGYFQQVLFDYYNPVAMLEQNKNEAGNKIFNLSLKGTYEVSKNFFINAIYLLQTNGNIMNQYYDKNDFWKGLNRNGLALKQTDNSANQLFETTVHYGRDFSNLLNLSILGGYSYQDFIYEGFRTQGGDFITDAFGFNNLSAALDFKNGLGEITSYKNSNKLIAFFGRVNLSLHNIWFLSLIARYEGSSRLGANHKWGMFPAVSGGMNVAKWINAGFIDHLKMRAGYGITGNQPGESYLSLPIMGPVWQIYYNGRFIPFYSLVNNANDDLKRENKTEFDAGLDFSIFSFRLSGSFDFYTQTASDLLFQYYVPVPPNLSDRIWLNSGKIRNSGIELTLDYNFIKKSDLSGRMTLTSSWILGNKLISLSGVYKGFYLGNDKFDEGFLGSPGASSNPLVRVEEGKPIGQLLAFVYKGIDENGYPAFEDQNQDGLIDSRDWTVVGNGLPKLLVGFGNSLTYKNWDINIFFQGVFGHYLINSFRAFYEVPKIIVAYNLTSTVMNFRNPDLMKNIFGIYCSKYVESASFISLDNLSLGYTFPLGEKSQLSKVRIYLAGNNLFYISKYKGADPNPRYVDYEPDMGTYYNPLVPGIDRRNTWCRTRSVTLGMNVAF